MSLILKCSACQEEKVSDNFAKLKTFSRGFNYKCKDCSGAACREWYLKNKKKAYSNSVTWRKANKVKSRQSVAKSMRKYKKLKPTHRKFSYYKSNARARNIEFKLTKEEFFKCFKAKTCAYCGGNDLLGLDRVNNKQGYILSNVVACCKKCNYMKRDYSKSEFLSHILKIAGNART